MAVGFGPMPGQGYFGTHQGIVWRSADGRTWSMETDPTFQFVTPEDVVAAGDALYVLGTIGMCDALIDEGCVEPPEAGWAVWRSAAGSPWERLPQTRQMQFGTVDGAISTSTGLAVFGWTGEEGEPIVWTSPDGVSWSASSGLTEMSQVTAIAQQPVGGLIAFGTRYSEELGDLELRAASAADAVNFAPVTVPALAGTTIQSVTAGIGGLVAVGETEDVDLGFTAVALQSTDGVTWTQATAADGSFANSAARFVEPLDSGYAATGFVPSQEEFGMSGGTSWFSSDGSNWVVMAPFGGQFSDLDASESASPGIVAFTVTEQEPDEETVISTISGWLAPREALSQLP